MYDDYPAIYETTLNQNFIYFIIIGIIILILLIVTFVSLAKIYKKANRSGLSAIIPFYNTIILLEIVNFPKWYFILTLIPILNLIIYIKIVLSLVKLFHKSKLFGLGLIILPFIFYPILAFNDSEYIGIDIAAIGGKTIVAEEHKIIEQNTPVVNEEVDEKSRKINISIGGGVYQKDYTKDLLKIDDEKTIQNINTNLDDIPIKDNSNFTFITSTIEEEKPEKEISEVPEKLQDQLDQIKPISEPIRREDRINSISEPIRRKDSINSNDEKTLINNTNIETKINNFNSTNIQNDELNKSAGFKQCPKCGIKINSGAKFCFLCGTPLK